QQQLLDAVTARDVADARLASARLQLSKSRVRAPWAGEVAPADEPRTATVRTVMPRLETVVDRAELPADLLPARRAVLAAEVPGVVEAMRVELGERLAAGALVAAIDTRALEQALAEAEAYHRQATAQHQRATALYEKRSITQQQLLDAVTARDVADARLASARLQLSKSRVRAPWAGEVAAERVEVGDYVTPGQPVAELVDASTILVRAPAPAADVPYLEIGAPVEITVDAFPGEVFTGRLVRLGAELDPRARSLAVEAELANPGGRLKPGMAGRLVVPRRTLADAVLVPLEALVDLGEERAVFVVRDGVARRRIVELGPVVGERVVIAAGVAAGEPVIVDGEQAVADGQPVSEAGAAPRAATGDRAAREAE
ncbi:MAG TPA: efflux RND transporter periplasmic adaptor subunit, partial [Thermoanaerobaculia bacterium]|nr:efflux RND transporter periplasmic adaptor subunit [Thermoanaerobaculia bacterium]